MVQAKSHRRTLLEHEVLVLEGFFPAGGSFVATRACNLEVPVGPDICHRDFAYTVLQTVQRPVVYSAAYGTVHYKEPLKSFEVRVGHSLGFGLPSVAISP